MSAHTLSRAVRSGRRGYVLVFVLVLLLVLTLLSTALLQTSYYDGYTMNAARLQSQAVLNANMGVQEGLARLRTGQYSIGMLPPCVTADTCPMFPAPVRYTDPGSRYTVTIFKQLSRPPVANFTFQDISPVVVVSATGQAVSGAGVINTAYASVLEVELVVPTGMGGLGSGAGGGNEKAGN